MDDNKYYWTKLAKINSFLLLILVILMVVALRLMWKDKATYLPVLSKGDSSISYPFLRSIVRKYPDTIITKCVLPDAPYFVIDLDKVVNGKHEGINGHGVFTTKGESVAVCMTNPLPNQTKVCKDLADSKECSMVYVHKLFGGSADIDIYHLAK